MSIYTSKRNPFRVRLEKELLETRSSTHDYYYSAGMRKSHKEGRGGIFSEPAFYKGFVNFTSCIFKALILLKEKKKGMIPLAPCFTPLQ